MCECEGLGVWGGASGNVKGDKSIWYSYCVCGVLTFALPLVGWYHKTMFNPSRSRLMGACQTHLLIKMVWIMEGEKEHGPASSSL